jgi:hypothetical protein
MVILEKKRRSENPCEAWASLQISAAQLDSEMLEAISSRIGLHHGDANNLPGPLDAFVSRMGQIWSSIQPHIADTGATSAHKKETHQNGDVDLAAPPTETTPMLQAKSDNASPFHSTASGRWTKSMSGERQAHYAPMPARGYLESRVQKQVDNKTVQVKIVAKRNSSMYYQDCRPGHYSFDHFIGCLVLPVGDSNC